MVLFEWCNQATKFDGIEIMDLDFHDFNKQLCSLKEGFFVISCSDQNGEKCLPILNFSPSSSYHCRGRSTKVRV